MPEYKQLRSSEHKPFSDVPDSLNAWVRAIPPSKRCQHKTLGLDFYDDGKLAPGYYVGVVWVGDEAAGIKQSIIVSPKIASMDYLAMYQRCACDSVVSQHLDAVLEIWPDQPLIDAELDRTSEILIIAAFLQQLNNLCQRHIRQNFIQVEENLAGKMKGKLMMGEHLKQNAQQLRLDRCYCQFQKISLDCLENRILRSALSIALRVIGKDHFPLLHQWGRNCLNQLASVPVVKILQHDFLNIRYSGTFSHYKKPHLLAKYILKRYGVDPHAETLQSGVAPPFAINMAELFERYCETKLRQESVEVWTGYDKNNLGSKGIKVRPDFLCKDSENKFWIVDAKYREKKKVQYEKAGVDQSNVYQVIAYSRHLGIQKQLAQIGHCDESKPLKLAVVYPDDPRICNNDKKILSNDNELFGFDIEFYRLAVSVPKL